MNFTLFLHSNASEEYTTMEDLVVCLNFSINLFKIILMSVLNLKDD